mgnify:CR=1 FL=1|tara:strand:+ start:529 stop:699 length:171 start_codon:yes stop_codon:yes gene_type:complete
MNVATFLALAVKHGIPAVIEIKKLLNDKKLTDPVTDEEWEKLEKLSQKTYDDYVNK